MKKWGEAVTTTTCKTCGDPTVYWETSTSGKKYLAQSFTGERGGSRALPHSPHTAEKCALTAKNSADWMDNHANEEATKRFNNHPDVIAMKKRAIESQDPEVHKEIGEWFTGPEADALHAELKAQYLQEVEKYKAEAAVKPKGFANKYPGKCVNCGKRVGAGEGLTSKNGDKWEVRCVGCHHG